MNVHTYHQHAARANSSFADVSVLVQTANDSIDTERGNGRSGASVMLNSRYTGSQEHLWSVRVTFLVSYKSPPTFPVTPVLLFHVSPCVILRSGFLLSTGAKLKRERTFKSHTGTHTSTHTHTHTQSIKTEAPLKEPRGCLSLSFLAPSQHCQGHSSVEAGAAQSPKERKEREQPPVLLLSH